MIKQITKDDLHECLEIFHRGYETVAEEFGLTEENCPDRGRASLPYNKLFESFEGGEMMYGYFLGGKPVGFLGMKNFGVGKYKVNDIIVLPEYRGCGYGKKLLDFAKAKAKELGASSLELGMIDDNKRLRKWYEDNGFVNIAYKNFENFPCTIGIMECKL